MDNHLEGMSRKENTSPPLEETNMNFIRKRGSLNSWIEISYNQVCPYSARLTDVLVIYDTSVKHGGAY